MDANYLSNACPAGQHNDRIPSSCREAKSCPPGSGKESLGISAARIEATFAPRTEEDSNMIEEHKATRGAFTLIELLVVIAIIALLLAILVPSLSTARELARRVVCQSNEKSIGMGFHLYASDYEDVTPPVEMWMTMTSNGPWRKYWGDFIAPYVDPDSRPVNNPPSYSWISVIAQPPDGNYITFNAYYGIVSARRFDCPSQKAAYAYGYWKFNMNFSSSWEGTGYHQILSNGVDTFPSHVTRIGDYNPQQYCVVLEPALNFYLMNDSYGRTLAFAQNAVHLGTDDGLFLDGHVRPLDRQEFIDWYTKTDRKGQPFYDRSAGGPWGRTQ
jgi:prepilin-type N-terminal cleavage/methylation domain-containing protein